MAWVRIDDHFDEHPKLQRVGPLGWGVWMAGLAYCNRNLTDGFIPWAKARTLVSFDVVEDDGKVWSMARSCGMSGEDIDASWVIDLLVDAGLWEVVENGRGRIDGYRIHDYEDYQPSKAQIETDRAKKAEAGRLGGLAKAGNRLADDLADAKQPPEQNASKTEAKLYPKPNPVPVPVSHSQPDENTQEPSRPVCISDAKPRRTVKTPVPDDLAAMIPAKVWSDIGEEQGMTDEQLRFETALMVDHCRKKAERYADWVAAWRSWMRSSYRQSRPKNSHAPPGKRFPTELSLDDLMQRAGGSR